MRVLRTLLVLMALGALGCLKPGAEAAPVQDNRPPVQDNRQPGKQELMDCLSACYTGNQNLIKCNAACVDLALCFGRCEIENHEVNDCFTECRNLTQEVATVNDVLIDSEEELETTRLTNNKTLDRIFCGPNCRNATEAESACIGGCLNGTYDADRCARDCQTETLHHDDICCEAETPDHVLCPSGCQNDLTICIPGCREMDATLELAIVSININ